MRPSVSPTFAVLMCALLGCTDPPDPVNPPAEDSRSGALDADVRITLDTAPSDLGEDDSVDTAAGDLGDEDAAETRGEVVDTPLTDPGPPDGGDVAGEVGPDLDTGTDSDDGDALNPDVEVDVGGAAADGDGTSAEVDAGDCGDGLCDASESCETCPSDCGPCGGSSCCEAHDSPGCDDETCAATICLNDPFCCVNDWDGVCAYLAMIQCAICGADVPECGDGLCEEGESCLLCPGDCGDCPETSCCLPHPEGSGCDDPDCEAIVCAASPACCEAGWGDDCVTTAEGQCALCDPAPACGDGLCAWLEDCGSCPEDCGTCESCCEPHDGSGCEDPGCEALVCDQDPFCCESQWDVICVPIAESLCDICGDG